MPGAVLTLTPLTICSTCLDMVLQQSQPGVLQLIVCKIYFPKFPLFPNSWGFGCCVTSGLSSKYSIVPTFRRRASSVAGDSNADYILRKESVRKTAIKAPKVCESCTKYVPPHAILLYIQNINTLQLYNNIPFLRKGSKSQGCQMETVVSKPTLKTV